VHLAVEAGALHHLRPVGLQGAAVVVDRGAGDPADQPVGGHRGEAARDHLVLAVPPPAADDVAALVEGREQQSEIPRVVLQVAVQGNDGQTPGAVEAGLEGRRLPVVAAEPDHLDAGVGSTDLAQPGDGAIGAAVVDQQQLPVHPQIVRRRADLLVKGRNALLLVVERNDDAQVQHPLATPTVRA
jgi:hypothetical protein